MWLAFLQELGPKRRGLSLLTIELEPIGVKNTTLSLEYHFRKYIDQ